MEPVVKWLLGGGVAGIWVIVALAFKSGLRLAKIETKLDIAAGQAAEVPGIKTDIAVIKDRMGIARPAVAAPVPSV